MTPWPMVPLRQLLDPVSRPESVSPEVTYRILGAHWYAHGLYTKDTLTGGEIQAPKVYRVVKGDFVYNRLFAWKGSFAVATEENEGCYVSNEFPCFLVKGERLDANFLKYYFSRESSWTEALGLSSGGTPTSRNRLKEESFLQLQIPLPPLPEQRRLVERIDALAAKIEEAKQLRTRAAFEAGHILQLAVDQEFHALADRGCRTRVPLREAATIRRGKFAHRPRNEPRFYGGCYPFIQIGDISASRRYIRDFSQTLNEQGLAISRMFPKGTVAIAITGATIGVTGILDFDSCFPDSIVGIEPISGITSSEFIFWALEFEKHHALAQATQTTQPNINLQKLNSLSLYLPPLDEQIAMANRLDTVVAHIDLLEREQNGSSAELDAMLPAILDRAFRGEL